MARQRSRRRIPCARSERLAKAATLVVLDLGQADSENMAITQLASLEPFATLSRYVTLEAEVRNFGRQARPHQLVELFVDGRRTGEEYVDVEAQGRATVSFPYRFDSPGSHAVELRLAADLLDIDNHRWLALDVKEQLASALRQRQARLERCGRSHRVPGRCSGAGCRISPSTTWYRSTSFRKARLLETDLARYDCLALADVGQFTANEAGVLKSYLERGGGLIVFLGEQVQADNYNRRLSGNSTEGCTCPAGQPGQSRAAGPVPLQPIELSAPDAGSLPRPGTRRAADHAHYRILQAESCPRILRPKWPWPSTAAIRPSSRSRLAAAVRSSWPPAPISRGTPCP